MHGVYTKKLKCLDWHCVLGPASLLIRTSFVYIGFLLEQFFAVFVFFYPSLTFLCAAVFFPACCRSLSFLPLFPLCLWVPLNLWIQSNPFPRWEREQIISCSAGPPTHCIHRSRDMIVFISHFCVNASNPGNKYYMGWCTSQTRALHRSLLHLSRQTDTFLFCWSIK